MCNVETLTPVGAEATINVKVNGKALTAYPNETILSAARRHDFYIPTLCELADIDHTPGTCRVCLVEIQMPGQANTHMVTACNTPVKEGLAIETRTKKVRDMQKLQVELLMADHLQDCATCTRHGSCELQDVAQFVGLKENRFFDPIRVASREVDHSSPAMVRDMTKCIRCQRCVTVCRNYQEVDALVVTGTGLDTAIGLRHGKNQKDSTCVTCGQCVLVCPTGALAEKDETDRVLDYIYDPEVTTVLQFAPAIRVGFGEEFGMPPGTNVEGQIIAAARKLGVDIVLDTNFGADVVIMEEGTELLHRLAERKKPTITSCCPAWINFAEIHYPELLPLLSSTRSPQAVVGAIAKTYLPAKMGLDPKRIRVISIMPCTAKKDEIVRPQLGEDGTPDVDVVLTTREFARLLKREGLDLNTIEPSTFDNPYMSEYTGAGVIFGTTGGVMEAALRTVYKVVNGKELDQIELTQLRGFEGVRSATVDLGGNIGEVKIAMAHGLGETRALMEAIKAGEADFDFIEIMACPGGCVDGGGTLRSKKQYLPYALKRRETMFGIDRKAKVRQSHNNEQVKALYRDFLGSPNSEKAHHLLHTFYTDRKAELELTVKEIWGEIKMSTMIY
ncbi:(2Fe-2S)-binding protein [Pleomorphomonas diazotrophica]|uniref:(2Fe-2S)-binding protein n=1 Tax=Pleomorphomonas diazotrophica TaxID=1166257 RepID=A0A1I4RKW8_9HYPH|nr:[FeFe] hydrogenase, group A [Pleomorphomonas diazotrophica]PKR87501.1 (2Fe-2S)-binding protein [Pleomorphomonas diazotrophica]SFM52879.1 ferredoxin hydrogenase gamma subunit [Pleomorphomonas diazotrophica]